MNSIATICWIVSFVIVTVTVTGLSRRVGWSAPVALVAVGAIVSLIPGVPHIVVEPDLILYGLLPPLLFAAAIRTPLSDIRARGDSIILLSVCLVALTVVVVGYSVWFLLPGVTLAAAFAFGAVVAPTDAVAVTAIAGGVKLSRRVAAVLQTESLLNDAAALVALSASIAAIGHQVSPLSVGLEFVWAIVWGTGVGLGVGFILGTIRRFLHAPVLDTSLSFVIPYIAFIPAQLLGGSGVLAVVVAGLFLGHRSPLIQNAEARVAELINWRTIRFLLENAVFLFIGLSLAGILADVQNSQHGIWTIIGLSVAVLLALILSRFSLVMLATVFYEYGPRIARDRAWGWRTSIAVSSAGIRGVVTLAAVFLLPEQTPERALLQLLAFVVVFGTLLEGLALPAIYRRLKLPPPNAAQERVERQMLLAEAQAAGLKRLDAEVNDADEGRVVERLRANSLFLTAALSNPAPEGTESPPAAYNRLRKVMIEAERDAVIVARAEGRYQDRAVRAVIAAIDAEEAALRGSASKPFEV